MGLAQNLSEYTCTQKGASLLRSAFLVCGWLKKWWTRPLSLLVLAFLLLSAVALSLVGHDCLIKVSFSRQKNVVQLRQGRKAGREKRKRKKRRKRKWRIDEVVRRRRKGGKGVRESWKRIFLTEARSRWWGRGSKVWRERTLTRRRRGDRLPPNSLCTGKKEEEEPIHTLERCWGSSQQRAHKRWRGWRRASRRWPIGNCDRRQAQFSHVQAQTPRCLGKKHW